VELWSGIGRGTGASSAAWSGVCQRFVRARRSQASSFGPDQCAARSYISEALMWYRRCEALSTYILGEVSSQLAEMLRKTINLSKKDV
jgi:hypothetical protein